MISGCTGGAIRSARRGVAADRHLLGERQAGRHPAPRFTTVSTRRCCKCPAG
ncbi:hypothetical protein M8494_22145 [Serratia ureilytica]